MRPQIIRKRVQAAASRSGSPAALRDRFFQSWASWREACAAVDATYRRWSQAGASESDSAFERYRAALDHEERAAGVHAVWANRLSAVPQR